ncbi:MAG: hypothetical protein N2504_02900 [candidate division WOR-3 bacterium]|nr:hypothetical protein [candidate division WOR-3 bacterium]MCX7947519.1 hypothetical protein [candidate division WOR-3 bacterium]MDW8150405.1 hypothetical protein [candidate division WOR-3 bacterium]
MINLILSQILNYSIVFSKEIKPDIVKVVYNFQVNKGQSETEVNKKMTELESELSKSRYNYNIVETRILPLYIIEDKSEKKVISGYIGYWTIEFRLKNEEEIAKLEDFLKKKLNKLEVSFEFKSKDLSVSDSLLLAEKLNYMKEIISKIKEQAKHLNEKCSIERVEFQDTEPTINIPSISQNKNSINFVVYITLNCNDKIQSPK